jgi:5-methylcytosine-specific restriction endonuclease McrA
MRNKWVTRKHTYIVNKEMPSYFLLLNDVRWKAKRNVILKRDNNRCVNCKSQTGLIVHHRRYLFIRRLNDFVLPWEYPNETLITLCNHCHNIGHKSYKIPIEYK